MVSDLASSFNRYGNKLLYTNLRIGDINKILSDEKINLLDYIFNEHHKYDTDKLTTFQFSPKSPLHKTDFRDEPKQTDIIEYFKYLLDTGNLK